MNAKCFFIVLCSLMVTFNTFSSLGQKTDFVNIELFNASGVKSDGNLWLGIAFELINPLIIGDGTVTYTICLWDYPEIQRQNWPHATRMYEYLNLSGQLKMGKIKDGKHEIQFWTYEKEPRGPSRKLRTASFQVTGNGTNIVGSKSAGSSPKTGDETNVQPPSNTVANFGVETNNKTGAPYTGVTADGTSSIRINLSGIPGEKMKFEIPFQMGALKNKGGIQAVNEPKIDQYIPLTNGSATVFYHPPKYISSDLLTDVIAISGRQVNCANVPISFTYKDAQGQTQTQTVPIKILRPLVTLVHGFTGDFTTWAGLAAHLKKQKFDCNAENYYALNDDWGILKKQDVFAQSRKLSEIIDMARSEYAASGVKMLKVDIVSHSMGGLIARYYINGYNNYRNDVRKLFMVGTPNHGIGDSKQLLGAIGAISNRSHFGMLNDVHEESTFMRNLNRNEATGGHLNPGVEYYNIFGTIDDGVTAASSAYIPGILFTQIRKCCHSPSPATLAVLGTPLTVHPEVYARVTEYLQKEIMRIPLKNVQAEIIQQKGQVLVDGGSGNKKTVQGTPFIVKPFDKIYTSANSSMTISFKMDGVEWGRMITGQNTSLQLKNYSPQTFTVRVVKGKARFRSNGASPDGSHFQVEILPDAYNKLEWYTFNPRVDVNSIGTTFDVYYDNDIAKIDLIEGKLRLDDNKADRFKDISTPQTILVSVNGQMSTQALQIDPELKQLDTGGPVKGGKTKVVNPLFAHVTTGGTLVNPHNREQSGGQSNSGNCLGKLKVQFIVPVGAPSSPQQQAQMKVLDDRNKWELRWFQQAEAAFKSGAPPKALSGTFRPDNTGNPGSGKYYSETVTLFKPMQIATVDGNARGFRLARGESQNDQHYAPITTAKGKILQCGSYKIYIDPIENIEKTWATLTFSEVGSAPPQDGGSGNTPSNPPVPDKPESCIDQMEPQFLQKVGAAADPQARMMMMKIDDENKREIHWFNQAAENYKRNVLPPEMSGTYRKQQTPSVANRSYYSETVTLFEPMKIGKPTGNSHGFMLMKDSREYKRFNTNQEAEGVVLPCGSYKIYPADNLSFATTKFSLIKIQK